MDTPPYEKCQTWSARNLLAFFSTKLLASYGTGATFEVATVFEQLYVCVWVPVCVCVCVCCVVCAVLCVLRRD